MPSSHMQSTSDSPAGFNQSYTGLRSDLLKHITLKNCSVLDVGCATGMNGRWLKESGIAAEVTGIELDPRMAAVAGQYCDRVLNVDLNDYETLSKMLGHEKFDCIIFGDVLEHLMDPWKVLARCRDSLRPRGQVILSIPNIGHIDTFLHLYVRGYWPYNDRGIYDRTHLRFFTLQNIKDLVSQAGLELVTIDRKFRYRDARGSKFPLYGKLLKTFFKDLYTFQYVVVCRTR